MTVSNKPLRIMENILRHDQIRALLWMDQRGTVKARKGSAVSMLLDADEPTAHVPLGNSAEKTPESIYICQFDGDDFLVVIFDDGANFDDIKQSVDNTLKR